MAHIWKVAEGGSLLQVQGQLGNRGEEEDRGGLRGEITGFSKASRLRLIRKLAGINQEAAGLPVFLTLTYPGEFPRDGRIVKRQLEAFRKAVLFKFPDSWGVWRLEYQERGAPHFHLLLWDGPEVSKECKAWVSETWFRCVGSGDDRHLRAGSRVEAVRSWRGVMSYASKYMAKEGELPEGVTSPGRFWAVIGGKRWKASAVEGQLTVGEWVKVRRVMRRLVVSRGSKVRAWRGSPDFGGTFFVREETGLRLIAWAKGQEGAVWLLG